MLARFCVAAALCAAPVSAQAQSCGAPYTVSAGDTAFTIAASVYGDPEKWTLLYYANEALFKERVFQIAAGDVLSIPCAEGQKAVEEAPVRQSDAELTLITGSNFAPFSDRSWPGNGMVTELVNAALDASPDPVTYSVVWNDNWDQHLFPGLDSKTYDMGFPWVRPDCEVDSGNPLCTDFHFSDSVVETLNLLFVQSGSRLGFDEDGDLHGRTLCRPADLTTHDLDRADRQWLAQGLVRLEQPATARQCFDMLMSGRVDAVTLNVFQGAETIAEMGLQGQIVPLERPLATETLHVVISKKHWRGTTHLYRLNAGLQVLRNSERYAEIVSKHLDIFWERVAAQ